MLCRDELARVVPRALTKDPEHRYQSAKDLRDERDDATRLPIGPTLLP